jgi:selenide,water dikinase
VYATGGTPFLALNLVGGNTEELSADLLADVMLGAQDAEGGWLTVGGHTVDDPEPKFGLVVVGDVHPDRMLTNAGLRPGQSLVLTKPLGIGVISTALKRGAADAQTSGGLLFGADAETADRAVSDLRASGHEADESPSPPVRQRVTVDVRRASWWGV